MLSFRVGVVKYTVQDQIDGIDRNPPPLTEPVTVPSARMHSDFVNQPSSNFPVGVVLKVNEFEPRPPGAGLKTVTTAVPIVAMSLAKI
jgi:hypothetical protein